MELPRGACRMTAPLFYAHGELTEDRTARQSPGIATFECVHFDDGRHTLLINRRSDFATARDASSLDLPAAIAMTAIGLLGLALLSLIYGDLLLQWQPAPKDAEWRAPAAYLSGVILLIVAAGLAVSRLRRRAALLGAVWIAVWVVALHVPVAIATKGSVAALLGVAEASTMSLGLASLALRFDAVRSRRVLGVVLGTCLVIFGVSHFVYAEFTASMVPGWIPAHLAMAYLTGAIHALTGLCVIVGFAVRVAASIEAAMMASFVMLLHVPRVFASLTNRVELTMLAIATTLTGAMWLFAATSRARRRDDGFINVIG
jgi:uncharacterized membrane protein